MLKLNAGFSRKVGEPNYGSRGASVNIEVEVESRLISDPDRLMDRVRALFALVRRAVDVELQASASEEPTAPNAGRCSPVTRNDRPIEPERVRYATAAQVRAIRGICRRQGVDPVEFVNDRFGVNDPGELTRGWPRRARGVSLRRDGGESPAGDPPRRPGRPGR